MTNIKILKDRIIFEGHADSRQECETITLMCDNLAQSKDFKTVRYESGYAEFEKVGATNRLMFAPAQSSVTIIFDSHVTKIDYIVAASSFLPEATGTLTSSNQSIDTTEGVTLNCTLQAGYIIDTVVWSEYDPDYGDSMSYTETSVSCYSPGAVQGTITITTKLAPAKQTIDVSTLSGWESLASGNHSITVKTKASGYKDSAASNAVTVSKAGASYNVTVGSNDSANQGFNVYDGTSTAGTLLATIDAAETKTVVCTTGFLYLDSIYGTPRQGVTLTGGITEQSDNLFKVTGDGTITTAFFCIIEGTQITLANGSTKAIEDITYDDELLVWNFYEGKFDTAKPAWIKVAGTVNKYCLVKFSNGAEVGFVGPGERTRKSDGGRGYHRIFNNEAGAFTYVGTEETPIGTTTFADDNSFPTVVSEEIIGKEVKFYNVITDKHFNIFANGILTSCRLSNMYRIENMKYVGERLITDEQVKAYFDERKAATKTRLTTDR